MSANFGQKSTVTDGLVLCLDAGNPSSGNISIPDSQLVNSGFSAVAAPNDTYGLQNLRGGDTYFVSMYSVSLISDQVIYSKDGITWSSTAPTVNRFWRDITFGNGKFVMVGNSDGGNEIQYASESNITSWTGVNPPESNIWTGVIYGNGKFVAVSSDGTNRVMYASESNLNSWSSASAAEANTWYSVAYGDGKFVAVSSDGTNRVMYALDSDVTSWTAASASEANEWNHVTYGDGYFVAVAKTGTNRVMYSSDGINWTAASAASAQPWTSLAYGDGYFVAVTANSDSATTSNCVMWAKSSDPSSWTLTNVAQAGTYSSVGFKQGRFVLTAWDDTTNNLAYADVNNRVWNDISKYRSPHMNYSLPWLWDLKGVSSSLELNTATDIDQYWGLTDGSGNNYGDISLFNFAASNYSIEFWINRYDGSYIMDMRGSSYSDNNSFLFFDSGESNRIAWRAYNGSNLFKTDTDQPSATNETWTGWRHYVITREGTGTDECKLYYNGSLVSEATDSGTHTTPGRFKIGISCLDAAPFKGKLALFKIYNGRALTATEILDSYNITKGRYE